MPIIEYLRNQIHRNPRLASGVFVGILLCFVLLNVWIVRQMGWGQEDKKDTVVASAPTLEVDTSSDQKVFKEVIRRAHLDPNREFTENIFYGDGQEVARFKNRGEEIFDVSGKIPDGEVKFVDTTAQLYGVEHYLNGKRHGLYQERYSSGALHKEIVYDYGTMQAIKEYFIDGNLRMQADFTDALTFSADHDVGTGKVLFRNGNKMYEWHVTYKDQNRYKKSYNIQGELIETKYFDQDGNLTKVVKYKDGTPVAP